jgi:hypothetical protein
MIITELFLNFAHQVLREGFSKLEKVYPNYDFYKGDKKAVWEKAFTAYQSFKGIPNQIANHYWNPTDFYSDSDMILLP